MPENVTILADKYHIIQVIYFEYSHRLNTQNYELYTVGNVTVLIVLMITT